VHESGFGRMIQHIAPKIILGAEIIEIQIKIKNLKKLMSLANEPIDDGIKPVKEQLDINSEVKNDVVILKAQWT